MSQVLGLLTDKLNVCIQERQWLSYSSLVEVLVQLTDFTTGWT
jgi:hypothetical protein